MGNSRRLLSCSSNTGSCKQIKVSETPQFLRDVKGEVKKLSIELLPNFLRDNEDGNDTEKEGS